MRDREIDRQLARDLDAKYRAYVSRRALALAALRGLLDAVFALAQSVNEVKAGIKMPFVKWCRSYTQIFDPKVAKSVCSVASRTHSRGHIETWQLRLLGVVSAIHHSARPQAQKRRHKPTSWISYISKSHEEISKVIERAGGIEKIPAAERAAIRRQLSSLRSLEEKL